MPAARISWQRPMGWPQQTPLPTPSSGHLPTPVPPPVVHINKCHSNAAQSRRSRQSGLKFDFKHHWNSIAASRYAAGDPPCQPDSLSFPPHFFFFFFCNVTQFRLRYRNFNKFAWKLECFSPDFSGIMTLTCRRRRSQRPECSDTRRRPGCSRRGT